MVNTQTSSYSSEHGELASAVASFHEQHTVTTEGHGTYVVGNDETISNEITYTRKFTVNIISLYLCSRMYGCF